jgi:hypothetical protein
MNVQGLLNEAFGENIWITIPFVLIIGLLLWYATSRKPNKGTIKKSIYEKDEFWLILIIFSLPVLSFFSYFTCHFYLFWQGQPENIDFRGWLMLAVPAMVASIVVISFSLVKIIRLQSRNPKVFKKEI